MWSSWCAGSSAENHKSYRSYRTYSSACAKSSIKSSGCSSPTDNRTIPGACAGLRLDGGADALSTSTPPRLRPDKSLSAAAANAPGPPRTSNESIPLNAGLAGGVRAGMRFCARIGPFPLANDRRAIRQAIAFRNGLASARQQLRRAISQHRRARDTAARRSISCSRSRTHLVSTTTPPPVTSNDRRDTWSSSA